MNYTIIQPPFTLNLREMPKKELRRYYQWFMDALPQRVRELAEAVKQTPGFETWLPDCTPESLDKLGDWFAGQVETRKRTEEELQAIKNRLAFQIDISDEQLTNWTFSLAMDIGMYFSQVWLKNYPSLQWNQRFGGKTHIDYGQPALIGFGAMAFNPSHMMVTLAYGLASKHRTGKGLREIYDIWSKKIQSGAGQ